jgi:dipeptidyl aminopeptidase/acylaminoacyl peptidase
MDYDVGHTFLGILDLETLTLENVTGTEFEEVSSDSAKWARNSDCIAFVGRRAGADERGLWLLDLTVDSPQDPFRELVPGGGLSLSSPSWSPDDTRVLFTKHGGRPKDDGLWLVDVTTGGQTLLLGHARNTYEPDWRRF